MQSTTKANKPISNVSDRVIKHTMSFWTLVVLIICMLIIYYSSVFAEEGSVLSELMPLLSAVPAFVMAFLLLIRNVNIRYSDLFLFLIFAVFLAISCVVNDSGIEHAFGLISILLGLYVIHCHPLKMREINQILALFVFAVILILLNGAQGGTDSVVMHKFNPNSCAFLLTMLYCVSIVRFFNNRKLFCLIFALICFVLQFYFISRTALLGEILFTLCIIVCRAWKNKTFRGRTVFWVILAFSVLGILIAYYYSEILYPRIGHGKLEIFGKDIFTGRQTIWNFTFESIREHLWLGVGNHLNEKQYKAGYYELIMNAHNQPLGTLAACGIFAFLLFYISFARLSAQPYRNNRNNRPNRLPAIFLLTVTVMSYFDIYFLSPRNWIAILIAYGLIFSMSISRRHNDYGIHADL